MQKNELKLIFSHQLIVHCIKIIFNSQYQCLSTNFKPQKLL